MKIVFITEILSMPFDEGLKNVVYALYRYINDKCDSLVITSRRNNTEDLQVKKVNLNKLFLNVDLMKSIREFSPDVILYVPDASYTFNSFLRASALKLMSPDTKVAVLGVQNRFHTSIEQSLIKSFLKPDMLFLLQKAKKGFFLENEIDIRMLPPAVDCVKFSPDKGGKKESLRRTYNISPDHTVVLHVGHIKVGRNIECLISVQQQKNMQVVVVGSTSISIEEDLKTRLRSAGVIVIDEYVPDISDIYKMADVYVFPVKSNSEAIDMPLSVLEAMATNLPVITTKFGALTNYFQDDAGFRYFNSSDELNTLIQDIDYRKINNSEKVKPFSWDAFTEEILSECRRMI